MRVYLLRTAADPAYEAVEADSVGAVQRLTRDPHVPTRHYDPAQDEDAYVHSVACQGVSLTGFDHYAIRPGTVVRLAGWNDDTDDHPRPWGVVWTFRKPRPDPVVGGRVNTDQSCAVYGNDAYLAGETTTAGPVEHYPWVDFPTPPPGLTFHGIWTDDDTNERHLAALGQGNRDHGWREWTD